MKALAIQLAAFAVALVAAIALLTASAAFSQAAVDHGASMAAGRTAALALAALFPAVLVATLVAALFERTRGGSLAVAALALASLAAGPGLLDRGPRAAAPAAAARVDNLVTAREILSLAEPGVWLYAGRVVGTTRLRDTVTIAADTAAQSGPRLTYVAEVLPGKDLGIGPYHLRPEPARLPLVAADPILESVAADIALVQQRVTSGGRESTLALAGLLLAFAGTGAIVRSSRWPLAGWSVALLAARAILLGYRAACGPEALALAARVVGARAPLLPTAGLLALGVALAVADVASRGRQERRRGARLV